MKKFVSIVLCVFWMGFIFYNSSNTALQSNKQSFGLLNRIKKTYHDINLKIRDGSLKIDKNVEIKNKNVQGTVENKNKQKELTKNQKFNLFLRKNAHGFEFFVLAILLANVFYSFKMKGKDAIIYILFICLLYAVTDEYHQLFVSGRNSSVKDVLIDFLGSIIGIVLYYGIFFRNRLHKNNAK